jgi:hypothetical protein
MANLPRIGELLVEAGVISHLQLSDALQHQREHGGRLGTNLVELGLIDEKTLAGVLARQLSIPSATAAQLERCSPAAIRLLSPGAAERLRAVPLREDQGKLWVAMADPTDPNAIGELSKATGKPVRAMVAPELLIQYALERYYKIKRRPRVVQVSTGGTDLLKFETSSSAPLPRSSRPGDAPASAPVYNPTGEIPLSNDLDALSGYLDEQPAPSKARAPQLAMKDVAAQLVAATSDDAIFDVAMRYVAGDVQRLAVFLLRNGLLGGWRGLGVDNAVLRGVNGALDDAPVVARVLSSGETWVGRLYAHELGGLAAPLAAAKEALGVVLPVRIGKRAVGVVIGLDASLEALRRKPDLDRLALKVDQALHISYLRRLLLQV